MNAQIYLLVFLITVIFVVLGAILSSRREYKDLCATTMTIDLDVSDMIRIEHDIERNPSLPKRKEGESAQDYIWSIAESLKIQNGGTEPISEQAVLEKVDVNAYRVTFQRGLNKEMCMFALAHECGHILNKDPFPSTRPDANNKSRREQLADYVGAALLLPKNDIVRFLEDNKYETASKQDKINQVKTLCKTYEVSSTVVLRRIEEILLMKATE